VDLPFDSGHRDDAGRARPSRPHSGWRIRTDRNRRCRYRRDTLRPWRLRSLGAGPDRAPGYRATPNQRGDAGHVNLLPDPTNLFRFLRNLAAARALRRLSSQAGIHPAAAACQCARGRKAPCDQAEHGDGFALDTLGNRDHGRPFPEMQFFARKRRRLGGAALCALKIFYRAGGLVNGTKMWSWSRGCDDVLPRGWSGSLL